MAASEIPELQFLAADVSPQDVRPWPRYFARMFDVAIFSTIVVFVLAVAAALVVPASVARLVLVLETGIGGKLLSNVIGFAVASPAIALLLAYGQSPGKWLFGIRIRDVDGRRMGFRKSLHRELLIWIKGVGLGIPVVSMIALFMSHSKLTDDGVTSWDKSLQCVVTHAPRTALWWIKATCGGLTVLVAMFYGAFSMVLAK